MKDNRFETEIDEIIRASMEVPDEPGSELNNELKAVLYRQEAAMRKRPALRVLSLWYIPMILNLATFIMLAVISLMLISNTYLAYFAAGICLYIGLTGILLTVLGVRRTNIKEDIAVCVEKRGATT